MDEFTKEQQVISDYNCRLARLHFFGSKRGKRGWVLHHKDETLKHRDKERYIQWNIEDLVPMKKESHLSLHHKGVPKTLEHRRRISKSTQGRKFSEEHRGRISLSLIGNKRHLGKKCTEESKQRMRESHLGKSLSDETKLKLSEVRKGMKFWNNGIINVRSRECPVGFVAGKLKH